MYSIYISNASRFGNPSKKSDIGISTLFYVMHMLTMNHGHRNSIAVLGNERLTPNELGIMGSEV